MKLFEVEQPITPAQLNALEKALDALFKSLGIDVEFTRHFIDRVNDERNQEQITMPELINMFKKEYKRWGKPIAQMGPDSEAVMKDLESDINIPFVLKWDRDNQELDLVAKSIMRKKNFKTSNKEFPVESEETIEEMPIPLSTMYGLVIDGKYVAKGSKADMRKLQKEKGGTVYNAPGKKVGDSEGKVKEEDETPRPMRRMSDEEKLAMFNELKAGDTVYLWYDSAFKRGEKYKPFKMGRRTKSEKYNLSKFSMQQISAEGIPAGVKFFLYKRGDKVSLAMGDMAATLVDMKTDMPESIKEMDDDTEQWYYQEVADHMGASLMNYKEMPGGRDITFGYKGQEVLVRQRWNKDGTEKKPVTTVVTDNDSADLGRYAVWNDSKFYADDLIDTISQMDEGYKISSKKPLSSLGGYGDKKLAKKQPSVGDGLSEDEDFYLVVEYKKGQPVRQSDPLRVLDNLAARRDNMPFPIKFSNDEEIKVTPELARRFTMAYHDIAKPEQKDLIKKYLKTKDGFKKVVNQMQLKKDDFGKHAGANLASLSRDSELIK